MYNSLSSRRMDEVAAAALTLLFLLVLGGLLMICCYYTRKKVVLERDHLEEEQQQKSYKSSESTSWTASVGSEPFYCQKPPTALFDRAEPKGGVANDDQTPPPPPKPTPALLLSLLEQQTTETPQEQQQLEGEWDGGGGGAVEEAAYGKEELQIGLLYLESLNELVVTLSHARNFNPLRIYKAAVRLLLRDEKHRITSRYRQSHTVTGQQNFSWNEHLSFEKLTETALDRSMSLRVAVLREVGRSAWEEIGWIVFSTNSIHASGRRHWLQLLSKDGFVTSWHYLAAHLS